ncbi:MAG: flagellar hook-associated protein FlgK [Pseudomonadota bacterium]
MSGIGGVLSIAKTALFAQQMAIEVTSHNVANVNTPGYTRQQLILQANNPTPVSVGQIGSGVQGQEIMQFYDEFMTLKVNQKASALNAYDSKQSSMQVIETLFNETTQEGMSALLGQFWAAWQDLGNNPTGKAERSTLVQRAELLIDQFQSVYSDLARMESDMGIRLDTAIEDVNSLTERIGDLNVQITSVADSGRSANDLRDNRQVLLRELSDMMDINYFETSDGSVLVMTTSGHVLVSGCDSWELELSGGNVYWVGQSGATLQLTTSDVQEGKLGGWMAIKDDVIPDYEDKMDDIAEALIWEVNSQHSQGMGLDPLTSATATYAASDATEEVGTADSGLAFYDKISNGTFQLYLYDANGARINQTAISITAATDTLQAVAADIQAVSGFSSSVNADGKLTISLNVGEEAAAAGFGFSDDTSNILAALGINTFFDGYSSGSIDMNSAVSDDPNNITAGTIDSATGDYSLGNNENALAISDLKLEDVSIGSETMTIESYYNSLVGEIGIAARGYARDFEFTRDMVNQLSQARDSVSGVSLDEEIANLVKYQHAYSAAAKLIQTADEMLQALLAVK